ncbi:MAG: hypothetical protein MJ078_09130, partial [Clostridia bacterium]|nr:hypothetical protein [Clostridia bacterium]
MLKIVRESFYDSSLLSAVSDAKNKQRKVILLVPEQQTVKAESKMADFLPASAPLWFEVANFSRLANEVFRLKGGLCYQYADKLSSVLFMWKALEKECPSSDTEYAVNRYKAEELCKAADELSAFGVSYADLEEAVSAFPDNSALRKKVSDLSRILTAWRADMQSTYGFEEKALDTLSCMLEDKTLFA